MPKPNPNNKRIAEAIHEMQESQVAEGMEKNLKKEPEYRPAMKEEFSKIEGAPAMKQEMQRKNYKSGKGWCDNSNMEGC